VGIRFRCHHCESELHVKDFQAGKRGRCPECKGKFRIPVSDAEHSLPAEGTATEDPTPTNKSSETCSPETEPTHERQLQTQEPQQPQSLREAPEAKWYVRPASGGQYGPAAPESMWQWLQENRIGREALVWREGWADWLIAANVFEDFFAMAAPPATASSDQSPSLSSQPDVQTQAPNSIEQLAQPMTTTSPTPFSEQNRVSRRQKRRRNYTIMIAILSVVMIGLIVALALVLSTQRA